MHNLYACVCAPARSPSRAYMNEEAVEYMLKNDGMGLNYDRR